MLYITSGKFKWEKKEEDNDHTHKVIGAECHQGKGDGARRWLHRACGCARLGSRRPGARRGSALSAVSAGSPRLVPQPSVSAQQRNMTMLAFFISLTLPLIKQ